MTASVPSGTDQSSRARPPDAVSPETPALAISTAMFLRGKRGLEPRYEALPFRQAETRGQRVAERHDPHRRGRIRNRNDGSGSQCNATNSRMQDLAQTSRAPI